MDTNTGQSERKFAITPEERIFLGGKRIFCPLRRFHGSRKRQFTTHR